MNKGRGFKSLLRGLRDWKKSDFRQKNNVKGTQLWLWLIDYQLKKLVYRKFLDVWCNSHCLINTHHSYSSYKDNVLNNQFSQYYYQIQLLTHLAVVIKKQILLFRYCPTFKVQMFDLVDYLTTYFKDSIRIVYNVPL